MNHLPAYSYESISEWFNYVAKMNASGIDFEITIVIIHWLRNEIIYTVKGVK